MIKRTFTFILLSLFLITTLLSRSTMAANNRDEIIKYFSWNLGEIYPSDEAFNQDYKKAQELIEKIRTYETKLNSSFSSFQTVLYTQDTLLELLDQLHTYATLTHHQNTTLPKGLDLKSKVEFLLGKANEYLAFVESEIRDMDPSTLDLFMHYPEMNIYQNYIDQVTDPMYTNLTKDQEKILALASTLNSIPQDIYETYIYRFQFPKSEYKRDDLFARNRETRQKALASYYEKRITGLDILAETLEAQIAVTTFQAKAKGFDSALSAAMHKNKLAKQDYLDLLERTNKALPLLHKWMEIRKKALNLDEKEQLGIYDLHIPLTDDGEKSPIKYSQCRSMIENSLKPLGTDYGSLLQVAFDQNWIFPLPGEHKYKGAYTTNIYKLHPYVLVNYYGSIDSVMTLTHELGHAMHFAATNKTQPYATSRLSIYTAEVASTTNEILLLEYLLSTTEEETQKKAYLFEYIDMLCNTFFNQVLAADFEYQAYTAYEKGTTIDDEYLNKLWADLQKKYYGDAFSPDIVSSSTWAEIPHFYNSFYVYQYATGITAGLFFADAIHNEDKKMTRNYLDFLASGSAKDPITLLQRAGIDMTKEEPYKVVFDKFETLIDDYEELMD